MEEDTDDFGNIYADMEGYVTAGVNMIPSIRQLYIEDRAKADLSSREGDDSEDEERLLYDRIGRDGRPEGSPSPAAAASDSRGLDGEQPEKGLGGGEVAEESNYSDSDDDLRIVLNEEDCKGLGQPQRGGLGSEGNLAGTNEGEEDESVTGTGGDQPSKEYKWAELSQLPVEVSERCGVEKCGTSKNGFVTPYIQFKYVRSQSAGCPRNAEGTGQGHIIPLSSPLPSKSDWDVSSLLAATSCSVGFPLPRNRTIFDISVETFDLKPWRNEGVDISDFFNFGLNEETWKQYCDNVVLFRKQATWMARNTIYGSTRPNQAFDSWFLHGATSAEASSSEVADLERGGTAASVVEKPKGKAIRVEGGSGERLPSMDTRRPRHQDSDVVIQVPVEGTSKDAMILHTEKPEHSNNFLQHSENEVYGRSSEMDGIQSLSTFHHGDHENGEIVSCHKKKHPESGGSILREPNEELYNAPESKGIFNEKTENVVAPVLQSISASADEVLHSFGPSSPERVSEASKEDSSADKLLSPAKMPSFGSVTGSDISVGSSNNTSCAERVNNKANNKANSRDHSFYLEKQRPQSEFRSVVAEDDHDSTDLIKKGKNNLKSSRQHRKFAEKSSCKHCDGEDPTSLEDIRLSKNSESCGCSVERLSVRSHTEYSRRSKLDPSSNANYHTRHKCDERSDRRCNDVKQMKYKMPKEDENVWGMEFIVHKETHRCSIPDHTPFCTEKGWSGFHRPQTWCEELDVTFEDRYKERYVEGNNSKGLPYFGRNEPAQVEFDSNTPYRITRVRDRRSPQRRGRHDQHLCIQMDDSHGYAEDDSEFWRYLNHRSSDDQTFRDSPHTNERIRHGSSPPRNYKCNSRRPSDMYIDCYGMSGARDARFHRQRGRDLLNVSSYRDHYEINSGHCSVEEKGGRPQNTLFCEGRKSSHVSRLRRLISDQKSHRQRVMDSLHFTEAHFSCKRIYRCENSCDNHKSLAGLDFLHSHSLVNENGIRVPRETDSISKELNHVRPREAVNGHLDGYEGKLHGKYGEVTCKKKKIRTDNMEGFHHLDEFCSHKRDPGKRRKMEGYDTHVIHSSINKVQQCDSENYGAHCNEDSGEPAVIHDQDISGLEEGQIVEQGDEDANTVAKKEDTKGTVPISLTEVRHAHEKKKQVKETSNSKKPIKEFDNSRILETLAKMEKRRARFKEPIVLQKEQGNPLSTLPQEMVLTGEVKLERPARKRRWGAVKNPAA